MAEKTNLQLMEEVRDEAMEAMRRIGKKIKNNEPLDFPTEIMAYKSRSQAIISVMGCSTVFQGRKLLK